MVLCNITVINITPATYLFSECKCSNVLVLDTDLPFQKQPWFNHKFQRESKKTHKFLLSRHAGNRRSALYLGAKCYSGFWWTEKFYASMGNWTTVSQIPGKHHTARLSRQVSAVALSLLQDKMAAVCTLCTQFHVVGWIGLPFILHE